MRIETYTYKSKGLAIALGIFLGALGAHRFYLGDISRGFLYLIIVAACLVSVQPGVFFIILAIDLVYIGTRGLDYFKRLSGYTETAPQSKEA